MFICPVTVPRKRNAVGAYENPVAEKPHHTAVKMAGHHQIRPPFLYIPNDDVGRIARVAGNRYRLRHGNGCGNLISSS